MYPDYSVFKRLVKKYLAKCPKATRQHIYNPKQNWDMWALRIILNFLVTKSKSNMILITFSLSINNTKSIYLHLTPTWDIIDVVALSIAVDIYSICCGFVSMWAYNKTESNTEEIVPKSWHIVRLNTNCCVVIRILYDIRRQ